MKIFISIMVTALLAFAFGLYLPWWSVAIAAFIVASFIYQSPLASFFTGFSAILLLWLGLILTIDAANENILAARVSMVMSLGGSYILVILSCFIGGVVGGFGALTGSLLRKVI
ncbi:MAG TPA: hypothetical protein VM101_12285 [Flavitalea sp.]|nr:hypothetical protein [Flavitalea sp.]